MNLNNPEFTESFDWAVIRLATFVADKNGEAKYSRLLFATVTLLTPSRPPPTKMEGRGLDICNLKNKQGKVFFRRVIIRASEAIDWYRSLDNKNSRTPMPSLKAHQSNRLDGIFLDTPDLIDDPLWPNLGLPLNGEWQSSSLFNVIKTCPFLGTVASRVHRRFGDDSGFESFLQDPKAIKFIARRLHINLKEYPEYLGSIALVVPDPIIQKINNFMVPAQEGRGERIFYHFIPQTGQSLTGLKITIFDIQAGLLSGFTTLDIPEDGILDIEKVNCTGEYGYAITHPQHGTLHYFAPTGFLRQINIQGHIIGEHREIVVPESDSPKAANTRYHVSRRHKMSPQSTGRTAPQNVNVRVGQATRQREVIVEAKRHDQYWFEAGQRDEAAKLLRKLIGNAQEEIIIADPYFGALQVPQFLYAVTMSHIKITVLTSRLAFEPPNGACESEDEEQAQMPLNKRLEMLDDSVTQLQLLGNNDCKVMVMPGKPPKLHDRFLLIDKNIWLLGGSLNAIGNRSSMMMKLPNPDPVKASLVDMLQNATPYKDQYQEYYTIKNETGGNDGA